MFPLLTPEMIDDMPGFFKWLSRPGFLIVLSIILVACAALVMFPRNSGGPQPLPVRENEYEIAFFYPATSNTTWERFVNALHGATTRLEAIHPGLEVELSEGGMANGEWGMEKRKQAAVPQVVLSWPEHPREAGGIQAPAELRGKRLIFRWYKLTSQWTPAVWLEALLARDPPPVAIIGGQNTNSARELALQLDRLAPRVREALRPLLLVTHATADRIPGRDSGDRLQALTGAGRDELTMVNLTALYAGRTFRFCFSNRQMATAVTRFIWRSWHLRPDSDPAYLVRWTDDSYSEDLFEGYTRVLEHRAADNVLEQWGWVSGCIGLGVPAMTLAGWNTSGFRHEGAGQFAIDSSVGTFAAPNPFEALAVQGLLEHLQRHRPAGVSPSTVPNRRSLLVVTGQAQPSRRFLRDLARSAPDVARRFVVASGDAISFNTIYRDRMVSWPIQDLPFALVFFCHRNPMDQSAGFSPVEAGASTLLTRASGTEDLLLYRDLIEATVLAFCRNGQPCTSASELGEAFQKLCQVEDDLLYADEAAEMGSRLFSETGQRSGGTGEHVVYIQPQWQGIRVLPRARIEVWKRQHDRSWHMYPPLIATYEEFESPDGKRAKQP